MHRMKKIRYIIKAQGGTGVKMDPGVDLLVTLLSRLKN